MNESKTVVGVDIAKRVFQLHWLDEESGEIVSVQLKSVITFESGWMNCSGKSRNRYENWHRQ